MLIAYNSLMFDQIKTKLPHLAARLDAFAAKYQRLELPARTVLLKEGEISRRSFYVEKGCLRVWFNNNGRDITFQFAFENQVVSSADSFINGAPSLFTIESIEPCIVKWVHKEDFDVFMKELYEVPELREFFMNAVFERQFHYMRLFLSFIKDTPAQRYLNLIKEQPLVVQRVPQHYIASYLGITPVSLSRIRNKLLKDRSIS